MIANSHVLIKLTGTKALTNSRIHCFSRTQDRLKADIKNVVDSAKVKKTVADMKNLKSFLNDSVSKGDFRSNVARNAQYDPNFREFLKSFNEKHKEYPNYIDVSHYMQTQDVFQKTPEMREDELNMLEEFRKRRREKDSFIHTKLSDSMDDKDDADDYGLDEALRAKEALLSKGAKRLPPTFEMTGGEFMGLFLYSGTTTLVTTLNRINHYRVLIFAGNMNGIVGYGKGKALDMEEAMVKANNNLKRNLISIPIDHFNSSPLDITAEYESVKLTLTHSPKFNAWGNPIMAYMLMLAGMSELGFKVEYKNYNAYPFVHCFFKAITQNVTPKMISEREGRKIYHEYSGRPRFTNDNLMFGPR